MKKEKKRTKFIVFFLQYTAIALVIATILMYAASYILYKGIYIKNVESFADSELKKNVEVLERPPKTIDPDDMGNFYNLVCFKAGVRREFAPGHSFFWVEDANTGEVIADSSRKVFLALKKDNDDTLKMYTCDLDDMPELRDNYQMLYYLMNRRLDSFQSMTYYIPISEELLYGRNYNFEYIPEDAYIKDSTFSCGKLNIVKCYADYYKEGVDGYGENTKPNSFLNGERVAELDYTPKDTSGYEHIELSGYKINSLIILGEDALDEVAIAKNRLFGSLNYTSAENLPFPGTYSVLTVTKGKDAYEREYVAYYYLRSDFANDCIVYLRGIGLVIFTLSLILAILIARKKYLENKFYWDMTDFRKCLMDSMAHDLKTPLTVMGGYAQNLAEDVNGEKRQYYADSIIKNVDYMNKIINDNLELSRLSGAQIGKEMQEVELVSKIEELFEKYKGVLDERGVVTSFAGKLNKKVNLKSIELALENLVSNAVKYVDDAGNIRVISNGKSLIIPNTASKKPEGKINDLWNPFVKGDKSRGNEKGTGLGLAIAKRIFVMNKISAFLSYDEKKGLFTVTIM